MGTPSGFILLNQNQDVDRLISFYSNYDTVQKWLNDNLDVDDYEHGEKYSTFDFIDTHPEFEMIFQKSPKELKDKCFEINFIFYHPNYEWSKSDYKDWGYDE